MSGEVLFLAFNKRIVTDMEEKLNEEDEDYELTEEQKHIIDLFENTSDNLQIKALAGSGKSSTLKLFFKYYNFPPTIKTFHSIGLKVWLATIGRRANIPKDRNDNVCKMQDILHAKIGELKSKAAQNQAFEEWSEIISAIGMAKNTGYVPNGHFLSEKRLIEPDTFWETLDEHPSDLGQDLIEACLSASIQAAFNGVIDYDDMCYMPAIHGGNFPRYDGILVDEGQDQNRVQHQMLWHMRRGARIVAVGDNNQSIYAFRGAVPGGMQKMAEKFEMVETDLSLCFRCPENVVKNVLWRTPHMKWFKPGGIVERLTYADSSTFPDDSAIICRNNAPLYGLAFKLLACGRNVTVSGSDIGTRVINIMKKLGPEEMTRKQLQLAIDQWLMEKRAKQSKTADDTAACMHIFAERGENLSQAIAWAAALFRQSGPLTLITGHKSKGGEWPVVFHLDPHLINDGGGEQEWNLRYVIQTRAQSEYYEINSEEIELDGNGEQSGSL